MRHMSEIGADVPAGRFRDRKCTFLELFQVPGTPIFLKICRELGEHVGDMAGQLVAQGEAAGHLPKSKWPASQKRWPAGHLPKSKGNFVFCLIFYKYPHPFNVKSLPQPWKLLPLPPKPFFLSDLHFIRAFQPFLQVVFAKSFSFKHFEVTKF